MTGSGPEGSIELSEEGVYSDLIISGEDIAGNHLRMAADCSLSQDMQDLSESPEGFSSNYKRILDRTPPVERSALRAGPRAISMRKRIRQRDILPQMYLLRSA
jgi:hypothetical protein